MRIIELSKEECKQLLKRVHIGRLACSQDDQPYVVPVCFSYESNSIYIFSAVGKKIQWMRLNPKVCLQADEIGGPKNWFSVIVTGTYLELGERQHTSQREHALQRLSEYSEWWLVPLAQKRETASDLSIEPVFFRIDIESMTGLGTVP
jgi:nitroimidazol reductase NimA-like FMN-containing flavoprotein (pyridoxamine 5'-phosphate oxidase superfamily)